MTFEEWFQETFPDRAPGAASTTMIKVIAKAAWEAGFQSARDLQYELDRLAEYDRSVFGMRNGSDW